MHHSKRLLVAVAACLAAASVRADTVEVSSTTLLNVGPQTRGEPGDEARARHRRARVRDHHLSARAVRNPVADDLTVRRLDLGLLRARRPALGQRHRLEPHRRRRQTGYAQGRLLDRHLTLRLGREHVEDRRRAHDPARRRRGHRRCRSASRALRLRRRARSRSGSPRGTACGAGTRSAATSPTAAASAGRSRSPASPGAGSTSAPRRTSSRTAATRCAQRGRRRLPRRGRSGDAHPHRLRRLQPLRRALLRGDGPRLLGGDPASCTSTRTGASSRPTSSSRATRSSRCSRRRSATRSAPARATSSARASSVGAELPPRRSSRARTESDSDYLGHEAEAGVEWERGHTPAGAEVALPRRARERLRRRRGSSGAQQLGRYFAAADVLRPPLPRGGERREHRRHRDPHRRRRAREGLQRGRRRLAPG